MNKKGIVLIMASVAFLVAIVLSFNLDVEDISGRTKYIGKTQMQILNMIEDSQTLMYQKDLEIQGYVGDYKEGYVICDKKEKYAVWDFDDCYPSESKVAGILIKHLESKDETMRFTFEDNKLTGTSKEKQTIEGNKIIYSFNHYVRIDSDEISKYSELANQVKNAKSCILDNLDNLKYMKENCLDGEWFITFDGVDLFFEYEKDVFFTISKEKLEKAQSDVQSLT